MTLDEVWTQLEVDLEWRHSELRLLSNTLAPLREDERSRLRRAMLVMLYAHLEGFCKVALTTYVKVINRAAPTCQQVQESIAAASFEDVFHALTYGDKKGKVFASPPPGDPKLLAFSRHRDFFAELTSLMERPVNLPESVVNTEDNLGADALRRNLFRLGFSSDAMSEYYIALDELKNRRNNIAHGADDSPIKDPIFEGLRKSVFEVMDLLTLAIIEAVEHRSFLRSKI